MSRRLGAACLVLVAILPGCGGGGGESTIGEKALRDCLAQAKIVERPQQNPSGAIGYAPTFAADFTAYTSDGTPVAIVVQGSATRARQTAADVRSAFGSLGDRAGAAARVIEARNAVAVFGQTPSTADRAAVRSCLAGS